MSLVSIKYQNGELEILDQLQLPYVEKYTKIHSAEDGWHAIKAMRVRGAPAIAIVAALALAAELQDLIRKDKLSTAPEEVQIFILEKLQYLTTSRPTAVNLSDAAAKLAIIVQARAQLTGTTGKDVARAFIDAAEQMLISDVNDNQRIGHNGATWIMENTTSGKTEGKVSVLTHCNTGSLATAGYGTALGVIRSLHKLESLERAFCTETRPYNQGSRLTAFELVHDQIPATLITDSMAAALLARKSADVSAVVVGADRVAANGDTANKIGTYALAVLAKHHGVKFLVAAPRTTIDIKTKSGEDIVIEERPKVEVTQIRGPREGGDSTGGLSVETVTIAAGGIDVWNPAFDVTPASLIDGIITEVGVVEKDSSGHFHLDSLFEES